MRQTWHIALREWRSLGATAMGYGVLVLFALAGGLVFLSSFQAGEIATMRPTFVAVSWILAVLMPAISMRLIAEELRQRTFEQLLASPLRDRDIVLGKWLGAMAYVAVLLLLLMLPVGVLLVFSNPQPDLGPIFTGWLGLLLVAGLYLSIGLWISAMTDSHLLAFMATVFCIGLVTVLTALLPYARFVGPEGREALFYMNVPLQYEGFAKGVIDPTHVAFFISGIGLFLFLAVQVLRFRRQQLGRWMQPAALAVIAVIVVVLFNAGVATATARMLRTLPTDWQPWVRIDVTASGTQSLSPRTRQVLAQLDQPYRIVTTLGMAEANADAVRDLVNLFALQSKWVSARHIAAGETAEVRAVQAQILERYADDLQPLQDAISKADAAVIRLDEQLQKTSQMLDDALATDEASAIAVRQSVVAISAVLKQSASQLVEARQRFAAARQTGRLPDFTQQWQTYLKMLAGLEQKLTPQVIAKLRDVADDAQASHALRETALRGAEQLRPMQQAIRADLAAMQNAQPVQAYDALRQKLESGQSVVVLGPASVAAVPVTVEQVAEQTPPRFRLSEDALAGGIASLAAAQPPRVVFVQLDDQPLIMAGGSYRYLAAALDAAGFEVAQQPLAGVEQAMNNAEANATNANANETVYLFPPLMPGQGAAEAMAGQRMNGGRNQRGQGSSSMRERLAKTMESVLAAGDDAIVLTSPDPTLANLDEDLFSQALAKHGLAPHLDRMIVWTRPTPGGRESLSTQITIADYPDDTPVTRGLDGQPAVVAGASPLQWQGDETGDALLVIDDPRTWLAQDFEQLAAGKLSPGEHNGPYVVAALTRASGDTAGTLAVIGSPLFAHDLIVSNADPSLMPQNIGSAARSPAAYPGNLELMTNLASYLAGMEHLIEAGESAVQSSRITPVSVRMTLGIRLLLLVVAPLAIASFGGIVLWRRRRG